ncbi:MAG: DNA polymerase/3'-5' exonuclease PolX [Methanothrix sp.]|uniref:DNA polymerase/3'-5' exonuclease PolX n=1 Tax=Methanothrix sp. TaxID=90426 RepID=UPI00247CC5BF|nr:DNA polymerase/3'-5' exonuclease PolX [Methanothrix sp.]
MRNKEIAAILYEMGELLEIRGENRFKVIAYSKAARAIESLKEDIEEVWRRGELDRIPGVGKAIAEKISEYLTTGHIKAYDELVSTIPQGMKELLQLQGVGPKTVALLHEKLNISTIDELEAAARQHRIRRLPGMGPTKEANILKAIERYRRRSTRIPLSAAARIVERIMRHLEGIEGLSNITVAGSFRRGKETVGDIDILATSSRPSESIAAFVRMPMVDEILGQGPTKASIIVEGTVQVDLRIVEPRSYGTLLQYFTGSKEHNVKLRSIALQRGYSLSEYSLKRLDTGEELFFDREEDVYKALGMQYIPPELREDRGEIEAALASHLPDLVELSSMKGDLHVHSTWSDGIGSIEDLVAHARSLGYEYVAITDHSPSVGIAGGLSDERLLEKVDAISRMNERLDGFRILAGTEVDIRADGSLDYTDDILERCDVVVAAIHMAQSQREREINSRLVAAMENEHVDIIAHPTGRIIGRREPYQVDMELILETAAKTGTIMEINAYPERLDLSDEWARRAKELGVKMAISTDAHSPEQLEFMRYGVTVARRGWLEPSDVINTLSTEELMRHLGIR